MLRKPSLVDRAQILFRQQPHDTLVWHLDAHVSGSMGQNTLRLALKSRNHMSGFCAVHAKHALCK